MKILVVDDRVVIGQAIGALIQHRMSQAFVSVVDMKGAKNEGADADLVLLVINGSHLDQRIYAEMVDSLAAPAVALVDENNKESARILLNLGVKGIMFTSDTVAEMLTTLRLCYQGFPHVPSVLKDYSREYEFNQQQIVRQCQRLGLTHRQLEVLGLLNKRLSNREIAEALFVSVATVKTHINHIYSALHVKNRQECMAKAKQLGLMGESIAAKEAI